MRRLALLPLAVLACLPLVAQGCSSDDDAAPVTPKGPTRTLHATSCKYEFTARAEALDLFAPKTDADTAAERVSGNPDIKRVTLGLGGTLTQGDPAYVDPTTSIAFGWETDLDTNTSTVAFGKGEDPAAWTDTVDGVSYTLPKAETAFNGADRRYHEVHVCGLVPDTTYHYRVGGGPKGKEVWSAVQTFRTLPTAAVPLVVAVTGDSRGENNNAWQILQGRLHKRGDVQLQLFSGDMVDLGPDQRAYENWMDHGQPAIGQILTLIAMGNHENYNAPFFASVIQPDDPAFADEAELFFSFDAGPAHFIVLDDFAISSPTARPGYREKALAWLEKDLAAAAAKRTKERPWIIANHHHGEWSSSKHGKSSNVAEVRASLVPLWDKYKADLILNGHDHNYERSKMLRLTNGDPKVDPTFGAGTTYVVCAGSGADGYGNGNNVWTEKSFSFEDKAAIGVYGILTLTSAKLTFEARTLTAAGDDPVEDSFSLAPQ